jgi:arginine metabolism regulation protein II
MIAQDQTKAQRHARMMLATAYNVPKVAKYKSILMALLTMVHAYI